MDNFDATDFNSINPEEGNEVPAEDELSHSDKMIGIFTEPSKTYEQTAKFPPKTIDWFLPIALLMLLVFLSQVLIMNNEEIAYQTKKDKMEKVEKQFDQMVKEGKMTREKADQAAEGMQKQFEMANTPLGKIIQFVAIFIFGFIFFFIVTGIYFLFSKFVLKGEGTYKSAMVANGLTGYIVMVQIILAAILAFVFGRLVSDTSAAALMNIDKNTIAGYLLAKIDPVTIWVYIVLGIGLAKMFKSDSTTKYLIMVFAVWIFGSLIFFALGQVLPFLQNFGG
ncbi:MAG: YIP1 family protein [Ignavibacteriaceae bacterium]